MISEDSIKWKKGFGRHVLATISKEVCGECLIKCICLEVCHRYSMVHGSIISWFTRQDYNVEEIEFNRKLKEASEAFRS
jgi:hypothetical protein